MEPTTHTILPPGNTFLPLTSLYTSSSPAFRNAVLAKLVAAITRSRLICTSLLQNRLYAWIKEIAAGDLDAADGEDIEQVDGEDEPPLADEMGCDLTPASGGRTEIDDELVRIEFSRRGEEDRMSCSE